VKIRIGYPDAEQEAQVLQNYQTVSTHASCKRMNFSTMPLGVLLNARQETAAVRVEPALFRYIVTLVAPHVIPPRLVSAQAPRRHQPDAFRQAIAATEGRDYLIPDDIKIARLRFSATAWSSNRSRPRRHDADQVVREIVRSVEVPK